MQSALFAEYWATASTQLSNPTAATEQWLLVTDSVSLKSDAAATVSVEHPLRSTSIVPTHVDCSDKRTSMLETLAELALLTESDELLHGSSAFADVAVLLCTRCRRSVRLFLDHKCPVQNDTVAAQAAWPRCFGVGGRYTAVEEMSSEGRLVAVSDAF